MGGAEEVAGTEHCGRLVSVVCGRLGGLIAERMVVQDVMCMQLEVYRNV